MPSHRSVFVSRAASAFSSLALTVVLAVLTILALALGTVQDSKAESNSGSGLLGLTKVEDPAFEWGSTSAASLPERSETAERLQAISRKPLSTGSTFVASRVSQGPAQEWMGMSKLAFPLLVGDLTGSRATAVPSVMTGRTVGVQR